MYKDDPAGKNGDKSFKFTVRLSSSEDMEFLLDDIEKRFLSYDESDLVKEVQSLNNDFSVDSYVHNEPPELLVAALNVGRNKFSWNDEKVMEIIRH